MNGVSLHGGLLAYGGTFLVFSDYARNAVRLACMMKLKVIWVYTHDSIGLGEDGPTHQPIEHLTSLRAMPNMNVWRPCDAAEAAGCAWCRCPRRKASTPRTPAIARACCRARSRGASRSRPARRPAGGVTSAPPGECSASIGSAPRARRRTCSPISASRPIISRWRYANCWRTERMAIKVGINGYGRIGRNVLRALYEGKRTGQLEIVALNDLCDSKTNAHLTRYDTVHGRFAGEIKVDGDYMVVNGDRIRVFAERDPAKLPWGEVGVEYVLECTGLFTSKAKAGAHLKGGAKKVVISAPGGDDVDATIVYGVNH